MTHDLISRLGSIASICIVIKFKRLGNRFLKSILLIYFIGIAYSSHSFSGNYDRDSLLNLLGKSAYDEALRYLEHFEDSMTAVDDSLKIEWLLDYNVVSSVINKTNESFKCIEEAIQIADKINSNHLSFKAKTHLIELYRKVQMRGEAIRLIRRERGKVKEQTEVLQSRFYHRAAAVYNENNYVNKDPSYLDTAILYSNKSLEISIANDLYDYQATSFNELGNIYERMGKMSEALQVYDKSISLWENRNKLNYTNAIKNKGSYFLRQQEYDSAISYFKKVLFNTRDEKEVLIKADTYQGLKKAYKAKGDSLNYLRSSSLEAHYVSLDVEQRLQNKIHDLSIAYEAKEKDILIEKGKSLIRQEQQQNKIILFLVLLLIVILFGVFYVYLMARKKNVALENLMNENEFLVGESNHRIKNNLQLITSIIGREIFKSKDSRPELVEISNKINSIATLHQHLYLSKAKEEIAIKDYLNNIIEDFNNAKYFGDISLKADVKGFNLPIEKSVYLGLLMTELLTNSIKHAFPDDFKKMKEISFSIKIENDKIDMKYADNGVGLKSKEIPSLVNLLARQLKAEIVQEENQGYQLHLKFNP